MWSPLQVKDDLLELLAVACLMTAAKQGERTSGLPSDAKVEHVTGMQAWLPLTANPLANLLICSVELQHIEPKNH